MSSRTVVYFLLILYVALCTYLFLHYQNLQLSFNTVIFTQREFPVEEQRSGDSEPASSSDKVEGPNAALIQQFLSVRPGHKYLPEFILNDENACKGANTSSVVVLVPTSMSSINARMFIRRTWGNTSHPDTAFYKVLFLVGSSLSTDAMQKVQREHEQFHDLIQIDAFDTYENLTYKSVSILAWAERYCEDAGWIIKADDDMVINPYTYRQQFTPDFIEETSSQLHVLGLIMPHSMVSRHGKWAMPLELYPRTYYPPYVQGYAYTLTRASVRTLYQRYLESEEPFVWVEDAYITGVLRKGTGIQLVSLRSYFMPSIIFVFRDKLWFSHTIFLHTHIHGTKVNEITEWYWNRIVKTYRDADNPN